MKMRINPTIIEDLEGIKKFIEEENENKAIKTIQEIYKQFENIQVFPYMGTDLSKRVSFCTNYKYVVWKDYVILYKIGKDYVEISRILSRYQDITQIFE